ncbi:uncharacterized protein LOC117642374 [Thrips palmi]|uniref:Uncharacterized protein LOC117642374 n=1 Tax=Thrips palmi TaxID=161013 RepID=A0A6P8YIA6_THRPL|nr:uncharacterized protein LOC117642374 [Thrips palmi]
MSKIAIVVVLAVAACLIPDAMSACSSRQLNDLENQLKICSKGIPVQMGDASWRWARETISSMKKDATCDLNNAPTYFQSELRSVPYIGQKYIDRAVTCITNSIQYGICC